MTMALKMFLAYIRVLAIDFFAIPIEKPDGLYVGLIAPDLFASAFGSKLIYRRKGERFARLRRQYSPITVCPILRPIAQVKTVYKRLEDVPKHCGLVARGFEIVVAETLGGVHVGDDAGNVDVIHPVYGRIETKIGEGRLYYAGVIKGKGNEKSKD